MPNVPSNVFPTRRLVVRLDTGTFAPRIQPAPCCENTRYADFRLNDIRDVTIRRRSFYVDRYNSIFYTTVSSFGCQRRVIFRQSKRIALKWVFAMRGAAFQKLRPTQSPTATNLSPRW